MALDPQLELSDDDPTAGDTAGSDIEQAPPTGTDTPPAQGGGADAPSDPAPERTYTQAEVRKLRQNMEREFRERYGAQRPASPQPTRSPAAPTGAPASDGRLDRLEMRFAEQGLAKRYPDFEKNVDAIVQLAAEKGLGYILAANPGAGFEDILDMAYWYWKREQIPSDLNAHNKKVGDQAVRDYLAKKEKDVTETPSPEGAGGNAPVTPKRDFSKESWDDVAEAAHSVIKAGRAST